MKSFGYSISMLSVVLLAVPAWENSRDKPLLFLCLVAGIVISIIGMALRWIAHRREHRERSGFS